MKNNAIIIAVVLAVVVGAIAFYGGMKYQQNKGKNSVFGGQANGALGRQAGRFGTGAGGNGFRPVVGQIIGIDDKSITVKLNDGSSKIVLLPGSVIISKTDTATKTDLKTGENVGVFGTNNSDGSVTAQNIQLNPMFRGGQGGQTATMSGQNYRSR